jgi:hypothetical protein
MKTYFPDIKQEEINDIIFSNCLNNPQLQLIFCPNIQKIVVSNCWNSDTIDESEASNKFCFNDAVFDYEDYFVDNNYSPHDDIYLDEFLKTVNIGEKEYVLEMNTL